MSDSASPARPRLLFVSPVPPVFNGVGNEKRAAANLAALARFFEIDLLVLDTRRHLRSKSIDPRAAALCRRSAIVYAEDSRIARAYDACTNLQLSILFRLFCPRPMSLALADAHVSALRDFLAGQRYAVLHAFRLKADTHVPHILSLLAAPPAHRTIDLDDIESEFTRRQAATMRPHVGRQFYLLERADVLKLKCLEWRAGRRYNRVFLCSAVDVERFRRMHAPRAALAAVPNIVRHPDTPADARSATRPRLLFIGNFRYQPNIDAVAFFHDEILPHLRAMMDQPIEVVMVGREPPAQIATIAKTPGFSLFADAPDLAPHYADADVVIAPLLAGSGTRIKILEAFSYRRAVVSTTLGAEGLEVEAGKDLLIADEPKAFAAHCAALMRDRDYRQRIADAGYDVFEQKYSPDVLVAVLGAEFGLA